MGVFTWKKRLTRVFLRNLYIRGRIEHLKIDRQISSLKKIIALTHGLTWSATDDLNVRMRIQPDTNFEYLIHNQQLTDAAPLARYLTSIEGQLAIDVGANRGYVSTVLARNFKNVIAFEPERKNIEFLKETLSLNHVHNVQIISAALSSSNIKTRLRVSESHGHHTLENKHISKVIDEQEIDVVRLDDFAEENDIQYVDLVKIDVEGHELDVLKGMKQLLENRFVGRVVFEHSATLASIQNRDIFEVFDYLGELNYRVMTLKNEEVNRYEVLALGQADLVAVPAERGSDEKHESHTHFKC